MQSEEQIDGKPRAVLYPIPPLLNGIIYDGNEYKSLYKVIEENNVNINLQRAFDLDYDYYHDSCYIQDGIIDITKWDLKKYIHVIDQYFVRAHEDIISKVRYDPPDLFETSKDTSEILERPVYTICVSDGGTTITIAENIVLDTEYGFKANESLSPKNMKVIFNALSDVTITGNVLIGNVISAYERDSNTITLVAATDNDTSTIAERDANGIVFTDTRLTNGSSLYTYIVSGSEITVNRNTDINDIGRYTLEKYGEEISLISPITNAIIVTQGDSIALSDSLVLNALFEGMTVNSGIKNVVISHWKFGDECSVKDMFAGWKDEDGNAVSVNCDVGFIDATISKIANKLSIELTVYKTGTNDRVTHTIPVIHEINPTSDSDKLDTQFTLNDNISGDTIDACRSEVIMQLRDTDEDLMKGEIYMYMETIPYVITEGVAYIRCFIVTSKEARVYNEPYAYVITIGDGDLLEMTVSVDKSAYKSVRTPPLKNPICRLYGAAGTDSEQGLAINYTNLAQGSRLNGEVDISYWSLRNVISLDGAFSDCISMTKLIYEHNDTYQEEKCNMNNLCRACTSLESVVLDSLPFNIESIDDAFIGCENLQNVLISGVDINTKSFNGLFNGCSYNDGVNVRIYNDNSDSCQVNSFIDTFTNVLSMNIKTNDNDIFHAAQNISWYFDDITNNRHGFNRYEYKVEQSDIRPVISCSRDTSIASIMESSADITRIDSTSIGPDLDYTGRNVQSITKITLIDATCENENKNIELTTGLSYIDHVLALSGDYQAVLNNAGLSDGVIIETLPDRYLTVLNNSDTITLRYCVPGDNIEVETISPPYIINNYTDQVIFDYAKIDNGDFNPPFRRPMRINSEGIQTITIVDPVEERSEYIRKVRPIYKGIVDYTHWDTETYLTKSVIENIFYSSNDDTLPHTIIAPYVSTAIIGDIIESIESKNNFTKITLYTYSDINGETSSDETGSSTNNYAEVTTCPRKINGMQGYVIECNKVVM